MACGATTASVGAAGMGARRTLDRPVGLNQLLKTLDSSGRAFPPRLPEQPIFYPVTNREYAEQIASVWNTKDPGGGFSGYVTRFDFDADYLSRFKLRQVGARQHQELWVPAEGLDACNNQLLDPIRVDAGCFGNSYVGPEPLPTMLRGKAPTEQLQLLHSIRVSSGMDFACELAANSRVVVANYLFWRGLGPALAALSAGVASALLDDTRRVRIESGACWPYDPSV